MYYHRRCMYDRKVTGPDSRYVERRSKHKSIRRERSTDNIRERTLERRERSKQKPPDKTNPRNGPFQRERSKEKEGTRPAVVATERERGRRKVPNEPRQRSTKINENKKKMTPKLGLVRSGLVPGPAQSDPSRCRAPTGLLAVSYTHLTLPTICSV